MKKLFAAAVVAAVVAAPSFAADGEGVYNKACAACHKMGIAGAPKVGDANNWGPRIAKGKDTLYKHAIEGFKGEKGIMPAKGGSAKLTDEEVKAAVDYMTSKSS